MNYIKKDDLKDDLYESLWQIKIKLALIYSIDAELFSVKKVPNEVKDLLYSVKDNAKSAIEQLELCLNTLNTLTLEDKNYDC